ncbi:hypothetical protein ACBI99_15070 [Nonomuraea sp. ATR24]|uniref:hypothetical protein n=1 Tax=Nonomuraea sp. ATR24 TaxID=1676744 RepID=UPI0035C06832
MHLINSGDPEADGGPLLGREPVEDAGSDTARWYEFQYACVARHCLDMAVQDTALSWILCEWHTDYALGWQNGDVSLVSVKHREANSGYWTVPRMFSDGGLKSLFDRWKECGKPQESRWVTNGGLDAECRDLQAACAEASNTAIGALSPSLASRFNTSTNLAQEFLATLRIVNTMPPSEFIRVIDIDGAARPILARLNFSTEAAEDVYDSILNLVREAAKSLGKTPEPWLLSTRGALDAAAQIREKRKRRTITRENVMASIRRASVRSATVLPHTGQPTTRLVKKLKAGEIVPSTQAAARRSRRDWTEYERGTSIPIPGDPIGLDFARLRSRITAEAAEAQRAAQNGGEPYGNRMLDDVRSRIALISRNLPPAYAIDTYLLMGLVYDLTAHCEIWWSAEFEVDDALEGEAS